MLEGKKLAVFVPALYGGGAEHVMVRLAGGFAERGYDVDLVLARAEGPLLADVPDAVRIVDLRASRVVFSVPALIRYLRQEKPFAVLSVMHANFIALLARRLAGIRTRVIISERNPLSLMRFLNQADLRAVILPLIAKILYPWADGVVSVSKGVAEDLEKVTRVQRDHSHVIYNPLNLQEVNRKMREPLDDPWFDSGQPPVILAVGRLTQQKDYCTLIRAFAKVRENVQPKPRLLILGEGVERTALEALIRQLGFEKEIRLPGFVPNPYPYMKKAAVYVLSSKSEGLPNALIEAMFCRVPLVSTDCPHGPREILADGQYGRLTPVGDVDAMADAIEDAVCGGVPPPPRESWWRFDMETIVDQYLSVLLGRDGEHG